MMTHNILTQFGHSVVESAVQIRHLVTNKLIDETENADPRVRIRALELLGKISDVGLFTEKTEVTINHKTTEELRESLRAKLSRLVNPKEDVVDAEFVDADAVDVDAELGIKGVLMTDMTLGFSETEIEQMLANLDSFSPNEIAEIDKMAGN